ncbi:phospholipase [Halovenus sp. WSH3]|uniref:Phospholipase n=1 Tax=Halovenus carboxidivorans TaxID=2692199 RepID=A0A6B0TDM2_9EURY|nr:phospholipase [Halovenus carboxidivorans]
MTRIDPHADESIATAGAPPQAARAGVVILHGRGDSPAGILRLVDDIYRRGVHYVAPAAAGRVWYPGEFTDPLTDRRNAYLDSALGQVATALDLIRETGVSPDKVVFVGFSQGAAVALEFVTRRARRYGGIAALAGGLLGPTATLTPREGCLEGTPSFCGVGADDPHVSTAHVEASVDILAAMGAETTTETYPEVGHAINDGEISAINRLIAAVSPE